jgi:hypothetical protein
LVSTKAGAVSVRVVVVVVVVVVAVVGVVLAVGVVVLGAVVLVVGGFAVVFVLDERELVADATALALAVVRLVALAEEDRVTVTDGGLLEPQAATSVASAMPSPSAVEVGSVFIGRV